MSLYLTGREESLYLTGTEGRSLPEGSLYLTERKSFFCLTQRGVSLPDWKGEVSPFHLEWKVLIPDWKRMFFLAHSETGVLLPDWN